MALTDNRNSKALLGVDLVDQLTVINADIVYAGGIVAIDSTLEAQPASDASGLRVVGVAPAKVDNTADGEVTTVTRGIYLLKNSSTSPITRAMIGEPCYVEDDQTVAGKTTYYVPAGLVHDVDSNGVWVDMTPVALATARKDGIKIQVAKTDDYTITAAQAFAGNIVFTGAKSGGMEFTLPSAVPGMRVGIQRINASSGYDVSIQAATGDKILGSNAGKQVDNTVDGVSGILTIQAADATDWVAAWFPADYSSWVINNG